MAPRAKYRVCPTCRGEGTMVMRAASVWTSEDRDADPDGFESMMRGDYDVPCDECGGKRVVSAQDERDFAERRADHFTMLREQGVYPGSPDYY
jgi:DnaJ-class molecular chaperone